MRISLTAIGRMKTGPETELFQKYFDRAKKAGMGVGFEFNRVVEHPESKHASPQQRKKEEAERILTSISPQNTMICLDERGENITSKSFCDLICDMRDEGVQEVCFVIGGPDGLSEQIRDKANRLIAFGKVTYPHMIMRILLMEQLYRSVTITTGHPYHRE